MYTSTKNKTYLSLLAVSGFVASLALAAPAFAQTPTNAPSGFPRGGKAWGSGNHARMPGVFGTVSAINGTTFTLAGKTKPNATGGTTYTVDASNAQVSKNGANSSLSAIAVGDMVMVQGAVSGASVTATTIHDGMGMMKGGRGMMRGSGKEERGARPEQNPLIQGNGQPIVGGTISAINGTSITVTNKSNVTYTVDASNATLVKMGTSTPISNLASGDTVIVQGTVNGTAVSASSIIDQGAVQNSVQGNPANTGVNGAPTTQPHRGFFGAIGSFFSHLFGF